MNDAPPEPELIGWKKIAEYLGKSVRTVQRWHVRLGLPVRRSGDFVIASRTELQTWLLTTANPRSESAHAAGQLTRLHELTTKMLDRTDEQRQRLNKVIASMNAARERLAPNSKHRERFTILAVDDNEAHNYVLSRILQNSGYNVLRAFNGEQALAMAAEQPGLILLDIHLPDLDGYEVCRRLKDDELTRTIPVVFVTATCRDSGALATAQRVGGETVLFYPVETHRLLGVIDTQLRN